MQSRRKSSLASEVYQKLRKFFLFYYLIQTFTFLEWLSTGILPQNLTMQNMQILKRTLPERFICSRSTFAEQLVKNT
jgi:hypothetical protein